MYVDQGSISTFLSKEVRNTALIKDQNEEELINWLMEEYPDFRMKTLPYEHQVRGLVAALRSTQLLLLFGPRLGKTKLSLDWLSALDSKGLLKKALVIVPRDIVMDDWISQVSTHSDLSVVGGFGPSREARYASLASPEAARAKIHVLPYSGIQSMFSTKVKHPEKRGKKMLIVDKKAILAFRKQYNAIIIDEIHQAKDRDTLRFSILTYLCEWTRYRLGLTGTLVGRDPFNAWGSYFLIDKGETFSTNYYFYRAAFGRTVYSRFTKSGKEWVFDKNKLDIWSRLLANRGLSYKTEECLDMPKVPRSIQKLSMTPQQEQAYAHLIKQHAASIESPEAEPVRNIYVRLREIAAGYIKEDEEMQVLDSCKLEWLEDFCEELSPDKFVIIYHYYTGAGKQVQEFLKKRKLTFKWLYGEINGEEQRKIVKEFQAGKFQFLLANTRCADTGLDLQIVDHIIYYESPESPIMRYQSEMRGMSSIRTRPLFIDDLVCCPIDKQILDYHKEGKSFMMAVNKNPKLLFEKS